MEEHEDGCLREENYEGLGLIPWNRLIKNNNNNCNNNNKTQDRFEGVKFQVVIKTARWKWKQIVSPRPACQRWKTESLT